MNGSTNWLLPFSEHGTLFATTLLMTKVSILLALAWCAHGLLRRANPRWRVLLWRSTGIGTLLLIALAASPPIVSWSILPPATESLAPQPTHALGPSTEAAHAESTGTAFAGSPLPTDQGSQKGHAAPLLSYSDQPSATSELDSHKPLPTVSPTTPPPGWSRGTVVFGLIGAAWLFGLVGLTVGTLVGLRRLRAIVRRSRPVPDWVSKQADRTRDTLGCKQSFTVRATAELSTPCLVGIRRPVVLLPEVQVAPARCEELPAILLHETAHLKARDLSWNAVLYALSLLFWPHPLAWRIRLAHANACETVADAVAANHVGDVTRYVRTLARLAVQMHSPAPGTALAMAGMSSVMQRIETLQRKLFFTRLPRGRMALAVLLATFGMGLLGGIALTRATAETQEAETAVEEVASTVKPNEEMDQLVVHATDAETGKPLEGVRCLFWGRIDGESYKQQTFTDERGEARVAWKAGAEIDHTFATWSKSGFVSQHHYWKKDRRLNIELPTQLQLKFDAGHTIGGIVQDEQGRPIEGAQVDPHMHWPWRQSYVFRTNLMLDAEGRSRSDIVTDAEGRWQWDGAPEDLSQAQIDITCPGYLDWMRGCRSLGAVCILKRGGTVSGRVVNTEGQPIKGADVRIGEENRSWHSESETKTDAAGRFVFENCPREFSVITVQAGGHSPQLRKVVVGEEQDVGDIQLGPAHTVRIRVVDRDGKPIQGAKCYPEQWREHRGLKADLATDAEGRVQWQSAPEDAVLWSIHKEGYMSVRSSSLEPSGNEHTITMAPQLVLRGAVTDAVTGEPLPAFQIIEGRLSSPGEDPWWSSDAPTDYQSGSYEFRFKYPIEGQYLLRVSAPGYEPAESRPIAMDEGAVTLDFALKPVEAPVKPPETGDNASKQNRLVIHANAEDTGKPLAAVKIRLEGSLGGESVLRDLQTDDEGTASLEWEGKAVSDRLFAACLKDGYVPIRRLWEREQKEGGLPQEVHLQFRTGKWIGGIVQDEDGQPIEGATVQVAMEVNLPKPAHYLRRVIDLTTGVDGRWSWQGVYGDLSDFHITINHPNYIAGPIQLRAGTETPYVMKRGGRVTGRVLTQERKPVPSATVVLGDSCHVAGAPKATTNSAGEFLLANCMPGTSVVTVEADGFSPEQREVVVGEQQDVGEIRLAPGHTIRLRLVDTHGNPLERAHVGATSWRGRDTLAFQTHADEAGRVVWANAPEDIVLFYIRAAGCMDLSDCPLQASEKEHVVTLSSELIVRGKVTDAKTGRPIPSFVIRPGFGSESSKEVLWLWSRDVPSQDGAYVWEPRGHISGAHRLRFDAPGYYTETSRLFKTDEGSVTFDIALEPGTNLVGTVLDPEGKPVAGAHIGLANATSRAFLSNGHFDTHQNQAQVVTTDKTGAFTLPPQREGPFLLIATHDSGVAIITREQFETSSEIQLEAWGRIKGRVLLGDDMEPDCAIQFHSRLPDDAQDLVSDCFGSANTNLEGMFEMERVIPGAGFVSRMIEHPSGGFSSPGWQQPVRVASSKTTTVTVGGTGRPVTGRFQLDRKPNATIDWTTSTVLIQRWVIGDNRADDERFECHGKIDVSGRFKIPDVPPGDYRLTCRVGTVSSFSPWAVSLQSSRPRPTTIGSATHDFTVPPTDEPLDVGTITVKVERDSQTDQ
jgi:beta-lactamase regulating signal transducer with metallopeptidase domain